MVDYSDIYDGDWNRPDRVGEFSFENPAHLASQVLTTCGLGRILDVGCGMGTLVRELLKQSADAIGVDVSSIAVAHCNRFMPGRFHVASVLALPFPDDSFDTIVSTDCLEHLAPEDVSRALVEMHRVCRRNLFLCVATGPDRDGDWHRTNERRGWWEDAAFAVGFRKHPQYYAIIPYQALKIEGNRITIPLEKIPTDTITRHPLQALTAERSLHMDMSRETGPRSDAHMARYALAAEWVRPGDTVLDCACGLGYGTAILAAVSQGDSYLGVDIEEKAVAYARDNFGSPYRIEYQQGDAEHLSFVRDASVDTLVSFETLEHVPKFERFLSETARVLKPDGRIVISVPNLWVDETGRDPNPYHHHVFDYEKTRAALAGKGFLVEARYGQSAPGGFKLPESQRTLTRLPLIPAVSENDVEWWILVASVNPLGESRRSYSHPDFSRSTTGTDFCVTDFARYYDNPWLYRPLVQLGERLDDTGVLLNLAQEVLGSFATNSPDYGAALAVVGYRILADKNVTTEEPDRHIALANSYIEQSNGNPHVLRWQISLAYLSAQLALKKGDRSEALRYFIITTEFDPCGFSPLLATKTIAAWFWRGTIHITDGDEAAARHCFAAGVETGRRALHAPDVNAIGNPLDPLTFGFPELAEVADMAGQCANALHQVGGFERSPGKFWRSVDLRRFGLATWTMNMEVELKELRAQLKELRVQLGDHRAATAALSHESSHWARVLNRILEKLFGVRLIRIRVLQRLRHDSE